MKKLRALFETIIGTVLIIGAMYALIYLAILLVGGIVYFGGHLTI